MKTYRLFRLFFPVLMLLLIGSCTFNEHSKPQSEYEVTDSSASNGRAPASLGETEVLDEAIYDQDEDFDGIVDSKDPYPDWSEDKSYDGEETAYESEYTDEATDEVAEVEEEIVTEADEAVYDGEILLYCKDEMIEHEEYALLAVVAMKINFEDQIRDIATMMDETSNEVREDAAVYKAVLSDSLRISLEFDPEDFKLVSRHQTFNFKFLKERNPYFDWEIEPLSSGNKTITVKLENYLDGSWINYALPQRFNINVKVNTKTIFARTIDQVQDDPQWLLDHVLLPLLTFFAGLMAPHIKRFFGGRRLIQNQS